MDNTRLSFLIYKKRIRDHRLQIFLIVEKTNTQAARSFLPVTARQDHASCCSTEAAFKRSISPGLITVIVITCARVLEISAPCPKLPAQGHTSNNHHHR